jgi:predicted RND superfamily exporter protein
MSLADRISELIIEHTRIAMAVLLLVVVVVGAGAPMVESVSSLDQFQGGSEEADKLDYVETNFGGENITTAQIIVRGENVLSGEGLIQTLEYQRRLQEREQIRRTLVDEDPVFSAATVIAHTIQRQQLADRLRLEERAAQLEAEQANLEQREATLEARRGNLEETGQLLGDALTRIRANPTLDARGQFEKLRDETPIELTDEHAETFLQAAKKLREADTEAESEQAYSQGTDGVLASESRSLRTELQQLETRGREINQSAKQLTADRERVEQAPRLSIAEQIETIDNADQSRLEATIEAALSGTRQETGGTESPLALLPTEYEPGTPSANATAILVRQDRSLESAVDQAASERTITAQLEMRDIAGDVETLDISVFGSGIIAHEIDASMADSLTIVAPLALLFVLVALSIAYRDLLDILLGVFGIGVVLLMTFGFMGWANIDFGQLFIAVPVLLIGLSIDYAIHIFMRYREHRDGSDAEKQTGNAVRDAMQVGLRGVGVALVFVTATTAIGFLSNLTSPVVPIQEFGIVSAVGIISALLVFGILIPSLKTELDERLEARGWDRHKPAFGTGGGRFSQALSFGAIVARRKPFVVIALVLLVTGVGAYGGLQVDTSFDQQDFLADDPPEWTKSLPGPFALDTYTSKSTLAFVNERFIRTDASAEILVQGNITDDTALERVARTQQDLSERDVVQRLGTGQPALDSPLLVLDSVAAENETVNQTIARADTTGDGVPDQNLESVYDTLFAVAPEQAGEYIYRTEEGQYRALRLVVAVRGDASNGAVTDEMQAVAAGLDGDGFETTATGGLVLNTVVQDQILDTVMQGLLITLGVIFLFLMGAYRITEGSALLGAVTLLPVVFASAWIVGSMYLLGIPFNIITGMILSLTIGLGVAYTIHVSERFTLELDRVDSVWKAMRTAVTGTGGALLGSGATTVGGFGVLMFAILPPLRQFGLITALSIVYAFIGSVLVLPTLLSLWVRIAGPEWAQAELASAESTDDTTTVAGGDTDTGEEA